MSSQDRIEALEAGTSVVETRTGKLAGSEKREAKEQEAKEQEGQMEFAFPPTEDEKEQEAVIEAVLFTMGRSVELRQLAAAIGQPEEVARRAVERLIKRYRSARSGMEITQLEDSYQMCTKAAYYENLIRVASAPKKQVLTEVVLETLSIIAYKQPVTKMEIEKIRGVKSDHAVNRLVEYNLVYEVGRLDAPGRPALFATTEEFLRRFGVGSVQDLPDLGPEQEAEIKAEVEEELQLKLEELTVEAASEEAAVTAEEAPGEANMTAEEAPGEAAVTAEEASGEAAVTAEEASGEAAGTAEEAPGEAAMTAEGTSEEPDVTAGGQPRKSDV
ncbi:MAG: SMC-Scp complex subunit ScpB [Clostridia bacterium]|nr:SMC-Scp complex subunit ScpB [Clostridia bacterium]